MPWCDLDLLLMAPGGPFDQLAAELPSSDDYYAARIAEGSLPPQTLTHFVGRRDSQDRETRRKDVADRANQSKSRP